MICRAASLPPSFPLPSLRKDKYPPVINLQHRAQWAHKTQHMQAQRVIHLLSKLQRLPPSLLIEQARVTPHVHLQPLLQALATCAT